MGIPQTTQDVVVDLEVARSERRFRLLAEAIPQIVWTTRPDGYCDYHNCRWFDYSGMTEEESVGDGWMTAVHPDDRARIGAAWRRAFQGSKGFEFEHRLRRADGVYRWFLVRAEPICDDREKAIRWFGTCTDIDEHKRVEDETLRQNGERLKLAAEAARLGYWDWDIVSDTITWSDNLERISGTSPEAFGVTFERFLELVHTDDRERVGEAVRSAVAQGTPYEEEYRLARPDGSYRWCLAKGQAYYDRAGRAVRMAGIDVDITERKRAEAALNANLEFAQRIADISPAILYVYDLAEGRSFYRNREIGTLLGYSPDEVVAMGGNSVPTLMHPADRLRLPAHFAKARALKDGEKEAFEFRLKAVNGEWNWFYTEDAVFERDGDGKATRLIGAAVDINARKRSEEALRASEERFRIAVDVVKGVIYEWDLGTDRVERSAGVFAITGFQPEEAEPSGDWWRRRVHPDDLEGVDRGIVADMESGASLQETEYRVRHRDGSYRNVWDRARAVCDAEGRPVRIIGCTIDITEHRLAEAALLENERRFRKLADSNILGVIFGDIHGGISYANDEYLRILGYSREEFESGRIGWATVTPREWLPVDERAIAQAMSGDGASTPYEKQYVRKDGTRISVLVGFTLFGKEETVAFILDLSERKRAEEVLREADRRKDEFLAMLAHELRNPLSALANALRMFRSPGMTDQDLEWASDVAERQLQNLVRLIDDLLDIARISSGKIHLRKTRLDAATVVTRSVESVRPFIEARRHELTVAVESRPMPMQGDPTRLEQVLANLLNNAAKYTDEGGRIGLRAGVEGGEAVIRVRDTGVGIAQEMLPKIFELFAQVDTSIDRSQGGLGIGLALVRMLVEMHGGRVSANSDGPGLGSEFTVWLPLSRSEFETGGGPAD
jgi:PAS domain S-box-containing protein